MGWKEEGAEGVCVEDGGGGDRRRGGGTLSAVRYHNGALQLRELPMRRG